MASRVLVTGAGGFVGGYALAALKAALPADAAIVALGREPAAPDPRAVWRRVDLRDPDAVERCVAEWRPTHTIHLAALASGAGALAAPAEAWRVNVGGSVNLVEALAKHAPEAVLIHASTAEIYNQNPANVYARTKAAAEAAIADAAPKTLRVVTFRPSNHTGPGQDERFVAPSFAAQIARLELGLAEPVVSVGDLSAKRDFLDVRDVAAAYCMAVLKSESLPMHLVCDLFSGETRSIGGILNDLKAMARRDFSIVVAPGRLRPASDARSTDARETAQNALAWLPAIPWRKTLSDVLDDQRLKAAHAAR